MLDSRRTELPSEHVLLIFHQFAAHSIRSAAVLCLVASWSRILAMPYLWHCVDIPLEDLPMITRKLAALSAPAILGAEKPSDYVHAIRTTGPPAYKGRTPDLLIHMQIYEAFRLFEDGLNIRHVLSHGGYPLSNHVIGLHPKPVSHALQLRATILGEITAGLLGLLTTAAHRLVLSWHRFNITHLVLNCELADIHGPNLKEAQPCLKHLAVRRHSLLPSSPVWPTESQLNTFAHLKQLVFVFPCTKYEEFVDEGAWATRALREQFPFLYVVLNESEEDIFSFEDFAEMVWEDNVLRGRRDIWTLAAHHTSRWDEELNARERLPTPVDVDNSDAPVLAYFHRLYSIGS